MIKAFKSGFTFNGDKMFFEPVQFTVLNVKREI